MGVIPIILICGIPMFIFCYNLLTFSKERPDYGTEPETRPFDGVITIGH